MRHVYYVSYSHMQQGIGFGFGWSSVALDGPITTEEAVRAVRDSIERHKPVKEVVILSWQLLRTEPDEDQTAV